MLGFLKNRRWREQVRLVTQNNLACKYLAQFDANSAEAGLSQSSPLRSCIQTELEISASYLVALKSGDPLTSMAVRDALEVNGTLRLIYDKILKGRREIVLRFGSSSERPIPFDKKFIPNERWPIYFDHLKYGRSRHSENHASNPAQDALLNDLRDMPRERAREIYSMGIKLAKLGEEQNLKVRNQQFRAKLKTEQAPRLVQGVNNTVFVSDAPTIDAAWSLEKVSRRSGANGSTRVREFHLLRLPSEPGAPYFEINNSADDEAIRVDLFVPESDAQPVGRNIHTRHMYRFDKQTALEGVDEWISWYGLPKLTSEIRDSIRRLTSWE